MSIINYTVELCAVPSGLSNAMAVLGGWKRSDTVLEIILKVLL